MNTNILSIYLVTDRSLLQGRNLCDVVLEAVRGGVGIVQLREKALCTRDFVLLARELKSLLAPFGVPLIINDRVDVALACDADGVHIGQSDMAYQDARRLLGPDKIIGLSAENLDDILSANDLDIDYVAVSPLFSTQTKADTAPPFGLDGLMKAVEISRHPVVAIGGINVNNIVSVANAGASGAAVVSAIIASDKPEQAAKELKNGFRRV